MVTCILAIIMLILPVTTTAQDTSERERAGRETVFEWFDAGVSLYEDGEFQKSAAQFEKILQSGAVSGPVYFNLGNAYFKQNQIARARLMYERAARFMPRDNELAGNIAFLKSNLEDKIDLPQPSLIARIMYAPGVFFNRHELSLVVLGLFLTTMLLAALVIIGLPLRNIFIACMVIVALLFIWNGSVLIYKVHLESSTRYAVTMTEKIPVRWGNTEDDKIAFYLHAGTKVIIRQRRGDWTLITIGQDKSGWVKNKHIEVI